MSFGYDKWRSVRLDALNAASEVVDTPRGPVEFVREGEAPFVLQFHGTPGGHDAGPAMGSAFTAAGVGVITLSRPGYLRTPLATGRTPAEQADAAAALLDALGVERVAAHGVSGGGPSAAEFAARHPTRAAGLLLTCAISDDFPVEIPKWASLIFSRMGGRLTAWLMRKAPGLYLKQMVAQESTLTPKECAAEARRLSQSPELLAWVAELTNGATTPWEDRRDGFFNDMAQFRAIGAAPLPLEAIQCPTLITHGTADGDVPFSHAEQAARRIPNATLNAMQDAWHILWICEGAAAMSETQVAFVRAQLG